jgi:hypothetical protein
MRRANAWLVHCFGCILAAWAASSAAQGAPRPGPAPRPAIGAPSRPQARPAPASRPATARAGAATDNAAPSYLLALAMLPKDQNHPDMAVIMPAGENPKIDDTAAAVIHRYDPAVQLLRRGAAAPRCDWGLDRSKGPELDVPQLSLARTMSQLVLLRARHGLQQKQGADACEDAGALMAFGRHIGQEPFIIGKMVESGVVQSGIDSAALVLMNASPEALARLDGRLAALPRTLSPGDAIKGEAEVYAGWFRGLEKADPAALFQEGGKLWKVAGGQRANPNTLETLKQRWTDPQTRAGDINALAPLAAGTAALLDAPPEEFPNALQAHKANLAAAPLASLVILPDPSYMGANWKTTEARLAMLRAAIAVRLKGPGALATIRDPFGSGPFTHKATQQGFELSSALQWRGGPVKLTIGAAP